jgi:CHAT domain-containing protein
MSRHYRSRREAETALGYAERAVAVRQRNLAVGATVMSEKDALTYAQFTQAAFDEHLSCFLDISKPHDTLLHNAAEIVLATKGQISDEIFKRQKLLVRETDSATVALAETYTSAKHNLSQLFIAGPGTQDPAAFARRLDSLRESIDRLEADLARRSGSFRRQRGLESVSMERIVADLPEQTTLVEFVRFDYQDATNDTARPWYLAVVVDAGGVQGMVSLGKADQIDRRIDEYRRHLLNIGTASRMPSIVDQMDYRKISRALYDAIWKPIASLVRDPRPVIIAPDGGLNLVSFAGLQDEGGTYLVEKYPLHYLTSARDIIRLSHHGTAAAGLLALGDPDFNASADKRLGIQISDASGGPRAPIVPGYLSAISARPLPGARREIEQIAESWRQQTAEPHSVYFGAEASEECLKAHASGRRVIHLATHGFFLEGAASSSPFRAQHSLSREFFGQNPLLLSGLLLAGANLRGEGADLPGAEDGILTAEEVTSLDLDGTELVVLSACETGLGRVAQGEGVYGLRRAFQMAGTRTVVSALWPVPDRTTAEMMSHIYEKTDESFYEIIRRIQVEELEALRRQGEIDHPYSWAAFIAVGDWR